MSAVIESAVEALDLSEGAENPANAPVLERDAASDAPFVDLSSFVDQSALDELDDYLVRKGISGDCDGAEKIIFAAEGRKYGDAIELCDRDTSSWCMDAFYSCSPKDDFKKCRSYRGDPRTWRPNHNARALPKVIEFVRQLPFFERTGKICIILNARNGTGQEHEDHKIPDLVSEFVWIRTKSSTKRFYVRDDETGEKHFVDGSLAWFDDHLRHNIQPVDADTQFSIRVDGRFTKKFRDYICAQNKFAKKLKSYDGRAVLKQQHAGPVFLLADPPSNPPSQ